MMKMAEAHKELAEVKARGQQEHQKVQEMNEQLLEQIERNLMQPLRR